MWRALNELEPIKNLVKILRKVAFRNVYYTIFLKMVSLERSISKIITVPPVCRASFYGTEKTNPAKEQTAGQTNTNITPYQLF